MFLVLSDLALLTRKEISIDATTGILASGLQGTWVTVSGTGNAFLPNGATKLAWPVFNESQRDQTVGKWAPDVLNTKKVTVLAGSFFARTTVFTGSPLITQSLDVNASGQLAAGTTAPVAYCVKAPYAYTYLGNSVTAMDIYVSI
jgi:hypothetical protein